MVLEIFSRNIKEDGQRKEGLKEKQEASPQGSESDAKEEAERL